ncbi:PKD domain-containing protein [Microbacterium sp. GXS0129]|uniref:PKD domain-containing protein n=1 Tax=Microbacterium sp. GXS0129 TaxID=3377836 RepID=UPI00383A928E
MRLVARPRRHLGAALGIVLALAAGTMVNINNPTSAAAETAPVAAGDPSPATVSADPLPTVQINGVVWSQTVVGDWVYAGGQFTQARPAGAARGVDETPRQNFLRYNLQTGEMDPNFNLPVNGAVYATELSPDGKTLYVGGAFTQIGGQQRYRLAAIDTATGAVNALNVGTNAAVYGIAATDDTVYLAGGFSTLNNVARTRVGAVSATTGKVLPFQATLTGNGIARSVVVSPDRSKVVVAGSFERTNGSTNPGRGIAALDATTGALRPWAMNSIIYNAGSSDGFMGLASDDRGVYGSSYQFATGAGSEGTFYASWDDGSMITMEDCHGDSYDVALFRGLMYKATHQHSCDTVPTGYLRTSPETFFHAFAWDMRPTEATLTKSRYGYKSFPGQPAAKLMHFNPAFTIGTYTGQRQATWTVTGGGDYVIYGGEFLAVNNTPQQGIVRFGTREVAPNKQGPVLTDPASFALKASSPKRGQVLLTWTGNFDPDDAELTYTVTRKGVAAPVYTTKATSTRWNRPQLTFRDVGLTPGTAYEYRITATDPYGNSAQSSWVKMTATTSAGSNVAPKAAFTSSVTDGLVSVDGTTSVDPDGGIVKYSWDFGNGLTGEGAKVDYRYAAAGSYPVSLTVTDDSGATNKVTQTVTVDETGIIAENVVAADAFERTTTAAWGAADTGGAWATANGSTSFDVDGKAATMTLAAAQTRTGLLKSVSAADTISTVRVSLPAAPVGGVVSATVLGRVVNGMNYSARVRFEPGGTVRLYLLQGETPLGGKSVVLTDYKPGTDVFVSVSVRGSSPTELGAKMWYASTVEPVTWQIAAIDSTNELQTPGAVGLMGSVSSLSTVPRSVIRFDDYSVTDGKPLVVPGQNNPPVAAFTATTTGLDVAFDASESSDVEGPIVKYSWDFGDGQWGEDDEGVTRTAITYAAEGQYTVKLTVTDNTGATSETSQVVSVTALPPGDVLGQDSFARSEAGQWGTAATGGVWQTLGGDSAFAVANGIGGTMTVAPSWTRSALLSAVQTDSVVVSTAFRADAVPAGTGAVALTVVGRQTDTGAYQARVRIEPNGTARLYILRDEAALGGASYVLPGKYNPGTLIHASVMVTGTGTTTVSAKAWIDGTTEPTRWQLTGTDKTDGFQKAGSVGLRASMSSTITSPQVMFTVTDFIAQARAAAR